MIQLGGVLGRGLYQGLGRMVPPGPFPFSNFFSFSYFLFSVFIFYLLQINSNQIKPISKIFLKINTRFQTSKQACFQR
jgi:hypothetical protein